jgi:hypothetical protein
LNNQQLHKEEDDDGQRAHMGAAWQQVALKEIKKIDKKL